MPEPEIYSPEWVKQEFDRLLPEVEGKVRAMFAGRGARFGAQPAMMQRLAARLLGEITNNAAAQRAQIAERKRQEEATLARDRENRQAVVNERMRQEAVAQTNAFREAADRRNEAVLKEERERKALAEERRFKMGLAWGMTPEQMREYGYNVADDDEKKRRGSDQFAGVDYGAGPVNLGSQPSSAGSGGFRTAGTPGLSAAPTLSAYELPYGRQYDDRANEPKGQPDYWQTSGDINENTPGEFEKFGRGVQDTFEQVGEGIGIDKKARRKIKEGWDDFVEPIGTGVSNALNTVSDPISTGIDKATHSAIGGIRDWWGGLWGANDSGPRTDPASQTRDTIENGLRYWRRGSGDQRLASSGFRRGA